MKKSNKTTFDTRILTLSLDRAADEPLNAQLAQTLRECILKGILSPGERLPSTRQLAEELSVSRVTIVTAYDQLISEGYAEGRRGSGVYVVANLPEYSLQTKSIWENLRESEISTDMMLDLGVSPARIPKPFETSVPDNSLFPHADWAKLLERTWRDPDPALLGLIDPFGWVPLREALARHLNDWRGIACHPGQIVITSGSPEATDLIAQTAMNRGDIALFEDPGYNVMRDGLRLQGMTNHSIAVDDQGFSIEKAGKLAGKASTIVVTPSRQYPLGMTMPLARRLELLDWAKKSRGLIIEDDYDSEYRYVGRPLPALMSLDTAQSVIYMGSFSKIMSKSLRLGFLVIPHRLIAKMQDIINTVTPKAALIAQPVLAQFIESGAFASHIRRMRRTYARRQKALLESAEKHLAGLLSVEAAPAGMHLVAYPSGKIAKRYSDKQIAELAGPSDVTVRPLSEFYTGDAPRQGLLLGYAGFDEQALDDACIRLAKVLKALK